jgi:hypothetical protein
VFIIADEKAMDEIDDLPDLGTVYYVLASRHVTNGEVGAKKHEWDEVTLFKRLKPVMGHGLVRVSNAQRMPLAVLKGAAFWTLPSIPMTLVEKIDIFFRAVYDKHKSEAILLLTYDPLFRDSANPGDGWGVVVPEQKNTGGSCKYEPESVAERKPPHVDIVGSWHSHPGMSAFASHTDEEDQVDFDGLHITSGWMTSKGGGTEYHVEYVLNNQSYDFTPADVFEKVATADDFAELDDWLSFVKKATPPTTTKSTGSGPSLFSSQNSGSSTQSEKAAATKYGEFFRQKYNVDRPKTCPDLVEFTVVVTLLSESETVCPVCANEFQKYDVLHRRCTSCFTYLMLGTETVDDVVEARKKAYGGVPYVPGLDYAVGHKSDRPVACWERGATENDDKTIVLWEPEGKARGSQLELTADVRPLEDVLACDTCGEAVEVLSESCPGCNTTFDEMYWEQRLAREWDSGWAEEELPSNVELNHVYGDDQCYECEWFMGENCGPMKDWLRQYREVTNSVPLPIATICGDFEVAVNIREYT